MKLASGLLLVRKISEFKQNTQLIEEFKTKFSYSDLYKTNVNKNTTIILN